MTKPDLHADEPAPRIPPLTPEDAPAEAQEILRDWPYNLHRTLARNIPTLTAWMPYAEHILRNNALPPREREIAILRVAYNAQCAYEWGLHVRLARSLGFSDADVDAIAAGADSSHWTDAESALVRGVDEIMTWQMVTDETWAVLAMHFDEVQLIDYLFVTSQFVLVAVTLNSLRVPLEPELEPLPSPA